MTRFTWILLVALAACSSKKVTTAAAHDDAGVRADDVAAPADAGGVTLDSPELLWRAFQTVHAGAAKRGAEATGKMLDALLSTEARALVSQAAEEATGALPTTLSIHGDEVRYKLLGETAMKRAAAIVAAGLEVQPIDDVHVVLAVRTSPRPLRLLAEREGGQWRLGPGPDLLPAEDELFSLPAGTAAPAGKPTAEAVAAAWTDAVNRGNGWDAYNLLAPSNRARLKSMIAQMGGSGDEDVVRILDKTIRDRRERGVTARAPTLATADGDRRDLELHYSDGASDKFSAVLEDGAWWIVLPL